MSSFLMATFTHVPPVRQLAGILVYRAVTLDAVLAPHRTSLVVFVVPVEDGLLEECGAGHSGILGFDRSV
jgi:hypothetical protein